MAVIASAVDALPRVEKEEHDMAFPGAGDCPAHLLHKGVVTHDGMNNHSVPVPSFRGHVGNGHAPEQDASEENAPEGKVSEESTYDGPGFRAERGGPGVDPYTRGPN